MTVKLKNDIKLSNTGRKKGWGKEVVLMNKIFIFHKRE